MQCSFSAQMWQILCQIPEPESESRELETLPAPAAGTHNALELCTAASQCHLNHCWSSQRPSAARNSRVDDLNVMRAGVVLRCAARFGNSDVVAVEAENSDATDRDVMPMCCGCWPPSRRCLGSRVSVDVHLLSSSSVRRRSPEVARLSVEPMIDNVH